MSRSLDIFVNSEMEIEKFVEQLESLFKIKLQFIHDIDESWYECQNSNVTLTLGTHDFENDKNMDFEDYRYHISVRALNGNTEEERNRWRNDFGDKLFEKLKETHQYSIMLVDDIQTKLAEFDPASNSVSTSKELKQVASQN